MKKLSFGEVRVGQQVTVLQRYNGNGTFVPDGYEGKWFVVGKLAPADLKLARHPDNDYDVIVHTSRILETTHYTDHPEQRG